MQRRNREVLTFDVPYLRQVLLSGCRFDQPISIGPERQEGKFLTQRERCSAQCSAVHQRHLIHHPSISEEDSSVKSMYEY